MARFEVYDRDNDVSEAAMEETCDLAKDMGFSRVEMFIEHFYSAYDANAQGKITREQWEDCFFRMAAQE